MNSKNGNASNPLIGLLGFASGCGGSVPGANEGPRELRSLNLIDRLQDLGLDVMDFGDATPDLGGDEEQRILGLRSQDEQSISNFSPTYIACKRLAEKTDEALQARRFPLILGGDHSLSIGSVAAVANFYQSQGQKIGLIWVDTHADINTPTTSPSHMAYGMSVAFLLGLVPGALSELQNHLPAIDVENLAYIGLRDLDAGEKELIRSKGIHTFTMTDIDIHGMAEVTRRAHEIANKGTCGYVVSFDIDVCDPQYVPGTGTPIRGGLTFRESHLLLELLAAEGRMLGFEIVELNPRLDKEHITADVALSFIEAAMGKTIL